LTASCVVQSAYTAILAQQQLTGYEEGEGESWSEPKRLWPPAPLESLGWMPPPISHALGEAYRCLFCKRTVPVS